MLIDENGDEIIVIKFERMGFSGVFLLPNITSALVYSVAYTIILMVLVYVSFIRRCCCKILYRRRRSIRS